jgi:hypothetical protein
MKKLAEILVFVSRVTGIEVKADKTKYMVFSRNHKGGQIHNLQIDNSSFERMEDFKYLGTNVPNENSIEDEIKGTLKPGNSAIIQCKIFVFQFAVKYIKIKINMTTILFVVLYGCNLFVHIEGGT